MPLSMEAKAAVLADNLAKQQKEREAAFELRLSYLADLAHLSADRIRQACASGATLASALSDTAEAYMPHLNTDKSEAYAISDRVNYVLLLEKELQQMPQGQWSTLLAFTASLEASVAYVRHQTTDLAFEALSDYLPQTTVVYTEDMREACHAVIEGECDFCLLPYKRDGVPLQATRQMLYHKNLHIVMSVTVEQAEFVLLSRQFYQHRFEDGPLYLSVSLPGECLHELTFFVDAMHGSFSELESYMQADKARLSATFRIANEGELKATLLFTAISLFDSKMIGFYRKMEE